ncbi:AAA family ATPase [Candidatus Methanarcanum hacksteinii]|uniref:AAA family ATPase n=1 Tax=Candidatus Methanarcanum hacksteinii TaxID=2911857 RepID=UPI0037DCD534
MKIFEVDICNYRQYKGENIIVFSVDNDKNFTIIQGDNGGGKSNLMNAIIWCLYGDEIFKSKNNEGREIINELAIQEVCIGESAKVSVSIKMGKDKVDHIITREVSFKRAMGNIVRGMSIFKVVEISDKAGVRTIPTPDWFIEKHFIPRDLIGFFFFDGEKMDEYFEDTTKVKQNVQKIAQIDVLQNSIDTLDYTIRNINADIKNQTPESTVDVEEIEELKTSKSQAELELKNVKDRIIDLEIEISKIEQYLRDNSDTVVRQIQRTRESLDDQLKIQFNRKQTIENNVKSLISESAPIIMSLQALEYSEHLIEEETQKGVLPPNVKDVFLMDLLEKGTCICGRDLSDGSEERSCVEQLLNQLMPSDISCEATQGRYIIQNMLKKKNFSETYKSYLESKQDCREQIESLTERIDAESDRLSKYNVGDIRQKEEDRSLKQKTLGQLNTRKGTLGNKIMLYERNIASLEEKYNKNLVSDSNVGRLRKQYEVADNLRRYFKEVKESILDDVRKQLEDKTRSYFFSMIWKKDAFSDVLIKDIGSQYKISVLSDYGNECLGDLSAGERQVLALSFTAALYSVSGYSVPVIIDTPLGRISGAPRDNIASSLPNYLSETQVVMLATDTEYTETVREKIKVRVGAEYKIKHDVATKTSKVIDYE